MKEDSQDTKKTNDNFKHCASFFLISEYKFRHIELSNDYQLIVQYVKQIQKLLKVNFQEDYCDELCDALLLFYANGKGVNEIGIPADCFFYIFHHMTNSIPYSKAAPHFTVGDAIDKLHYKLIKDANRKEIYIKIMDKLLSASIQHGIFITRILNFRDKKYLIHDLSYENIFAQAEPLFPNFMHMGEDFNKDFSKKNVILLTSSEHMDIIENDHYNLLNDPVDRISFFVKLAESPDRPEDVDNVKLVDLEETMATIKAILIGYLGYMHYAGNYLKMLKEFKYYKDFVKYHLQFQPTRITEKDFSDKVIGILIWDSVRKQKLSIKKASSEYLLMIAKSNRKDDKNCEQSRNVCNDCATLTSCERKARELYSAANKSIQKGEIILSRKNLNKQLQPPCERLEFADAF